MTCLFWLTGFGEVYERMEAKINGLNGVAKCACVCVSERERGRKRKPTDSGMCKLLDYCYFESRLAKISTRFQMSALQTIR